MNLNVLIDAIVRQTTILLAQLATASGERAYVADLANKVFLDLVRELKAQGLGNKVIADMFGMVLRSYHKKVRRLSESATDTGRSLWEAVFSFLHEHESIGQGELMKRFQYDDNETVRGVLRDLVESGLVFRTGRGATTMYRLAAAEELSQSDTESGEGAFVNFVWMSVYRNGPIGAADLTSILRVSIKEVESALHTLQQDSRVTEGLPGIFQAQECVVPFEAPVGWETAVFDHFQALVTTITAKLQQGRIPASRTDDTGGSTYAFDVWPGHPLEAEVLELFCRTREDASDLRKRVDAHNASTSDTKESYRVTFYAGQNILKDVPAND